MQGIDNLLNKIGDFHFCSNGQELSFMGVLTNTNGYVTLNGQGTVEQLQNIDQNNAYQIWGNIDGTNVTLLNSLISLNFIVDTSLVYGSFLAEPTEIIIGRAYSGKIYVTKISTSITALNYMFSERLFFETTSFSKEDPTILSFSYPHEIRAVDSDGEICLSRTFQHFWSWNRIEYKFLPNIEYAFSKSTEIGQAIAKIASARNLCSFFSDYYLPLENITFSDEKSPKIDSKFTLCDCQLYMNNKEDIEISSRPFLLMTKSFSDDFSNIWNNWLRFYNENIYIPTLFYEIICNRSTRINRFLNLAQAIEIYSNYYRDKEARCIAEADGCKKKDLPLKYRIEDILLYLNEYLEIDSSKIVHVATAISKSRNFFTHYNKERYDIPSVQEVSAGNRFLRFVLLSIVYKTIGIKSEHIKRCKRFFEYSTFERDISIILKEKKDIQYTSWFE